MFLVKMKRKDLKSKQMSFGIYFMESIKIGNFIEIPFHNLVVFKFISLLLFLGSSRTDIGCLLNFQN